MRCLTLACAGYGIEVGQGHLLSRVTVNLRLTFARIRRLSGLKT